MHVYTVNQYTINIYIYISYIDLLSMFWSIVVISAKYSLDLSLLIYETLFLMPKNLYIIYIYNS